MPTSPDTLAGNSKLGHFWQQAGSPALPDPASASASAAGGGLHAKRQTLSALTPSGSAAATVPVSRLVHGFGELAVPTAAVPDLAAALAVSKAAGGEQQFGLGVACAATGLVPQESNTTEDDQVSSLFSCLLSPLYLTQIGSFDTCLTDS